MRTRARLNLTLGLTFLLAFCASSALLWRSLMASARDEVRAESLLRMEAAMAMRRYTMDEVAPLLVAAGQRYAPPAIPAHAAIRTMALLEQQHPQYRYREVAVNPTLPAHRATGWQLEVIAALRQDPALAELERVTDEADGPVLHIARPVRPGADCMACHGSPAAVAPAMLAQYGPAGTGWRVGDTVGAQIVSVPMAAALAQARTAWWGHVAATVVVFGTLFAVLNRILRRSIIAPIELRSSQWQGLAYTDALTGALNRRSFDERAAALAFACAERDAPLAIIAMDIDHFKDVNDRLGHATGDHALAEFARRIQRSIRRNDAFFRMGGEEFMLLLPDTEADRAATLAETLRSAIADAPFDTAGPVTASFGVTATRQGEPFADTLARADRALYAAKGAGRNRVEVAAGSVGSVGSAG